MSRMYFLSITIESKFDLKNVQSILQTGSDFGLLYYHSNQIIAKKITALSINQASDILLGNPNEWVKEEDEKYLDIKYKDTILNLLLHDSSRGITLSYFFSATWKKDHWNNAEYLPYIDFSRYIRLLLDIYKNFNIVELIASAD